MLDTFVPILSICLVVFIISGLSAVYKFINRRYFF